MRKHQQKKILELISTLNEAHGEIKRLLSQGERSVSMQLLADCQDCAIGIIKFIEQIEGSETQTTSLLEKYNEFLYFISVEINQLGTHANSVNRLQKQLQKQIITIKNTVVNEFSSSKFEVVFLPYKASMFDSLESIWLAAKEDPRCDAFIVPIPYYDRLPNGQFGLMHCERDKYPSNIPTVSWQEYNLEARRPDVIFIHYPYDDGNYVTSIHPDYYSERLKKFTDLLVYVPYFVNGDDVEEHFCVCAGTIYADKVILQSEKMRQTYIRVFKEFEIKNNCVGRFGKPDEKFIALGSPKFDAVINAKFEDFTLPEEWRNLIEEPDGAKKKVVFYNTSVSAILKGGQPYIEKIRYTLDTFSKRNDTVLWWRPHPLNKATYQSMRPQLLDEYERIVANYKLEGWGIYDDTSDLHRAITVSDAYYGDGSSIITLYGITGKLIMWQNTKLFPGNMSQKALSFIHFYDDGEYFWFSAWTFNGLFRMNRKTWETEYILSFPSESGVCELYSSIVKYEDKLYFSPFAARDIFVYDTKVKSAYKLTIPINCGQLPSYKYSGAVSYKNFIYFIPFELNAIVRFNIETEEFDGCYSSWQYALKKIQKRSENINFRCHYIADKFLILPAYNAPSVVVFDMETGESDVIKVGDRNSGYNGVCFDGENFWLAPLFTDSIVKWNRESGYYKEYDNLAGNYLEISEAYISVEYLNGYVWCFPHYAQNAIKINVATDEISIADEFQIESVKGNAPTDFLDNINYVSSKVIDDTIYVNTGKSNTFIAYNTVTRERREEHILLSNEQLEKLVPLRKQAFFEKGQYCKVAADCIFKEDVLIGLNDYLDYIVNDGNQAEELRGKQIEIFNKLSDNSDGSAGQVIWDYTKKLMPRGERL